MLCDKVPNAARYSNETREAEPPASEVFANCAPVIVSAKLTFVVNTF